MYFFLLVIRKLSIVYLGEFLEETPPDEIIFIMKINLLIVLLYERTTKKEINMLKCNSSGEVLCQISK